jgi:L-ribulose-5-phosphate 3-epimerase
MKNFSRRNFLRTGALAGIAGASLPAFLSSSENSLALNKNNTDKFPRPEKDAISLATFSLNRSFNAGIWKLTDIARICREDFNIDGIEYVTLYFPDVRDVYLKELNDRARDYNVKNVLIMVDREGDMGAKDRKERMQSAINHRKWVEIAAYLGCHAIRCNCTGVGESVQEDPDALERSAESFNALLEYAKEFQINIVIENHGGGLAKNAEWLAALCKKLNNPNFGLLPDYGNFGFQEAEKTYEAVRTTMPCALGVSVKGTWLPDGTHPRFDLNECLRISKESGYKGFYGIESGIRRPSEEKLTALQAMNDDWRAVRLTIEAIKKIILT